MRELKFRAWDEELKSWIYCNISPMGISWASAQYTQQTPIRKSGDKRPLGISFDNVRHTWGQFTGLRDKNGVEIYEGDIVSFGDPSSDCWMLDREKETAPVEWYQDKCAFLPRDVEVNHKGGRYIHLWEWLVDVEVIGNIHEEPR